MILVDTNLLLYAVVRQYKQHQQAREWLDERLNSVGWVGLPWESLVGFVRLVTNSRVFPRPLSAERAWEHVEDWLDRPTAWVPIPGEQHRRVLGELVRSTAPSAGLVHDAHLAALAVQHGLIVASTDGDFARFPGVRWENPLDT